MADKPQFDVGSLELREAHAYIHAPEEIYLKIYGQHRADNVPHKLSKQIALEISPQIHDAIYKVALSIVEEYEKQLFEQGN